MKISFDFNVLGVSSNFFRKFAVWMYGGSTLYINICTKTKPVLFIPSTTTLLDLIAY